MMPVMFTKVLLKTFNIWFALTKGASKAYHPYLLWDRTSSYQLFSEVLLFKFRQYKKIYFAPKSRFF